MGWIEIHIIRHKQIELTVAIVVQKTAARAPAVFRSGHASLLGHVGKRAVAVIVVKNVAAKVGDEEIVKAVVVVVADATGLSPAGTSQAGLFGDIGEGAVTIVVKQITGGIAVPNRRIKAGSVHQKNIEPAVVVIVEQRHPATHLLEQKLLVGRAAGNVPGVPQPGLASDVGENDGRRRVGSQQMRGCQSEW